MKCGLLGWLFGPREFETSRSWEAPVAQPMAQPQVVGRPVVSRDPVMTRYVRFPLTAAVICGLFPALLLAGIAAAFVVGFEAGGWWYISVPVTFVLVAVVGSGAAWYWLFIRGLTILEFLERLTGMDLNNDNAIGKPPEPKETVVRFIDEEKRQMRWVTLPMSDTVVREVAEAMLQTDGHYNFSRRDMRAATSISDKEFRDLQTTFLEHGWAAYREPNKPNSGVVLLAAGRAVLAQYL